MAVVSAADWAEAYWASFEWLPNPIAPALFGLDRSEMAIRLVDTGPRLPDLSPAPCTAPDLWGYDAN